jgi:superoxide reductase
MKFYVCAHCGNIIEKINDAGVPVMCCGEKMKEMIPGTSDGAAEKHVPVWKVEGGKVVVNVGEVDHPMIPEHFIGWVALETKQGVQRKYLKPGEEPNVTFSLGDDKAVAVYAYCNLHGLWKTEV